MQRALKAWDGMSHEQRETQARAMRISLALREKLCVLQQLHDELIEDAIETQKGASQLEEKLRRRVLPLLDECETGLRRVKDELRLGRETTDTLAGLLRDTTRALLEAPIESVKMVKRRVPSMFAIALTRWINEAQGSGIDLDTVFHEVKKIGKSASTDGKSNDDGGKRKRAETSEDCGEDGSERVGEGPSGGTHIHIRDLSGRVNGDVGVEARDSLEDDEVLSTTELPNNADGSHVPVSGIAAAKTQGKNVNQNSNALTSSSADHTVSPTEQNNIQAPGPTTLAHPTPVWSESPPPGSRRAEWDMSSSDESGELIEVPSTNSLPNNTPVPVWDEGNGEGAPRFPWELSDSE